MDTKFNPDGMSINADTRIIDIKVNELVEAILARIPNLGDSFKQDYPDDFISAEETAKML